MKMLCIRGRTHVAHTGLFAGRVYEVSIVRDCCGVRAWAEGSVFKRPTLLGCLVCGNRRIYNYVPWDPNRFVPWQPDALKSIKQEAKSALTPRKRPLTRPSIVNIPRELEETKKIFEKD